MISRDIDTLRDELSMKLQEEEWDVSVDEHLQDTSGGDYLDLNTPSVKMVSCENKMLEDYYNDYLSNDPKAWEEMMQIIQMSIEYGTAIDLTETLEDDDE